MFQQYAKELFQEIEPGKKMVLSTSYQDHVTSRLMSVIAINGKFYFQTDSGFRKYEQIIRNSRAALCFDNIQIEGVCRELGHPSAIPEFCECYRNRFPGSYEKYTGLRSERVFEIQPTYIQKWIYVDGKPFIEQFDFTQQEYRRLEMESKI